MQCGTTLHTMFLCWAHLGVLGSPRCCSSHPKSTLSYKSISTTVKHSREMATELAKDVGRPSMLGTSHCQRARPGKTQFYLKLPTKNLNFELQKSPYTYQHWHRHVICPAGAVDKVYLVLGSPHGGKKGESFSQLSYIFCFGV